MAARADRLQGGRAGTARQATVLQCGEAGEVDGAQTVLGLQCWESGGASFVLTGEGDGGADGAPAAVLGVRQGKDCAVGGPGRVGERGVDGAVVRTGLGFGAVRFGF